MSKNNSQRRRERYEGKPERREYACITGSYEEGTRTGETPVPPVEEYSFILFWSYFWGEIVVEVNLQ